MSQEIEVQLGEVIIADYELKVFNKDNGRVILNRFITDKELAKYEHFVHTKRTIDDFKQDLSIAGKLLPMNIKGGVVLTDSIFTMKSVRLV